MIDADAGRTPLDEYRAFREEVDRHAKDLFARYAKHLQCRRGCYFCCDAITVLPIEVEALRRWRRANGDPRPAHPGGPDSLAPGAGRVSDRSRHGVFPIVRSPAPAQAKRCAFLGEEGECTVYDGRPTICRTHGLPLAYRVYEYDLHGREMHPDGPEYTDLYCELNFATVDEELAPALFDRDGRINMDAVNRRIEELNDAFLKTEAGAPYRDAPPGQERIELGRLLKED